MIDISEEEISGYGFKNPKKLLEIINRFSKKISEIGAKSHFFETLELDDETTLELQIMDYENKIELILKNHCT